MSQFDTLLAPKRRASLSRRLARFPPGHAPPKANVVAGQILVLPAQMIERILPHVSVTDVKLLGQLLTDFLGRFLQRIK
jgi:hypothetical protein